MIWTHSQVKELVKEVLDGLVCDKKSIQSDEIPIGVSNRHIHLSKQDLETLFGKGYTLTPFKD